MACPALSIFVVFRSTLPRRERPSGGFFFGGVSACFDPRSRERRFPNWLRRQRKASYLRESAQIAGAEVLDGSIGKENIIFFKLL